MSSTSTSSALSPISQTDTDAEKGGALGRGSPALPPVVPNPRTTLSSDIEKEMEQRVEDTRAAAVSATAGTRTSVVVAAPGQTTTTTTTTVTDSDSERPRRQHRITAGRPDAATLIAEAVRSTPNGQRVLVAACGPQSLMTVVRDTTARLVRPDGPAVELHCEQFGW